MGDTRELVAAFESGTLLPPSPDVPNIVDLARALARLAGVEGIESTPGMEALAATIGPAEHLVFVLADGLGVDLLGHLPRDAFLRRNLVGELRTVFPSTTAVALTSLATGAWPADHGITGWWTHLSELGDAALILPFVTRWDGRPLSSLGLTLQKAFPLPSLMSQMRRDTLALLPERLAASAYSTYSTGGRPRHGYTTLREATEFIAARVRVARRSTYTYLYATSVDDAGHRYGAWADEVRVALVELDRELEDMARGLPDKVRIVLTADHGFLDARNGTRHQVIGSDPILKSLRFAPSGDARVLYLHARDGETSHLYKQVHDRLGERFLVLTTWEAARLGLFGPGPLQRATLDRLGDLVVISRGQDVIEYRPNGGPGPITSKASHHSGLSPSEMRVPFVVA